MNNKSRSTHSQNRTSIEALEQRIAPAGVFKWNVNASGSWTTPGNWLLVSGDAGAGYPDGFADEARFTEIISANRVVTIPDGVQISVNKILFDDNNSYTIAAAGSGKLFLEGGDAGITGTTSNGSGTHTIQAPMELRTDLTITNPSTSTLIFQNVISDDGGFRAISKDGAGMVEFTGTSANTFNGTTSVLNGTLQLSKTAGVPAVGGNGVNVGGEGNSAVLVLGASQQIPDDAGVGVLKGGTFDLANFSETLNVVVLPAGGGAKVQTGTGTLTMKILQAFSDTGSTASTISGKLNFVADNLLLIGNSDAAVDLDISAVIGGSSGLKIQGDGTVQFSATLAQTYTGQTSIRGATLLLDTTTSDAGISNNVRIFDGGTLKVTNTFEIPDSASIEVDGGNLEFTATDDFTNLTLKGATVNIGGTAFFTIRSGGSVNVSGGEGNQASVIDGGGTFSIQQGIITLDVAETGADVDLLIGTAMAGSFQTAGFTKTGTGKLVMEKNGTFLGGVTVAGGALQLNGTLASSVTISGGRVERGNGFNDVGAGGFTTTAGRLETGENGMKSSVSVTLGAGSIFAPTFSSFQPGLAVTGAVNLNGATLEFYDPEVNSFNLGLPVTLIDNDGSDAVSGIFAGLPQGAKVVTPNGNYFISYTGGTGNDVVLTREILSPTILPGGKAATFIDKDGDLVTVKITKGELSSANFTLVGSGVGAQLIELKLNGAAFSGSSVLVSAVPKGGVGDKRVDISSIDSNVDLGAIVIPGDLGRIEAGDSATPGLAVKSLVVNSFGLSAPVTSLGSSYVSDLDGGFGTIKIKGDIVGANLQVKNAGGTSGVMTIGGSLLPGTGNGVGFVSIKGNVTKVSVGGDVVAGLSGANLQIQGNVGQVFVGGSVFGGTGVNAGALAVNGNAGMLTIMGDVVGSSGVESGRVVVTGTVGTAKVGGDVLGGTGADSGRLAFNSVLKSVTVAGDVRGGSGAGAGSIDIDGVAKMVKVAGSVYGGGAGGGITAQKFGAVVIGRDLVGTEFGRAVVAATGTAMPGNVADALAIGSVTVGKNVRDADILAGYDESVLSPVEADAQIGKIQVKGNWSASRALVGVDSVDGVFGNADDQMIGSGSAGITARIASIVIGGSVQGTAQAGDGFGFVAQAIGTMKVGGKNVALNANAKDVVAFGPFGDTFVREL